jgi:hypothetical protein
VAGSDRFDSDSFHEGLGILVADVNRDDRPEAGNARLRAAFVGSLVNRLKTTAYLDAHPHLLERPIERPVFVFGIPRTGTTLLNNLLAADPARRSPLTWEIDDPVPPATAATLRTDPRALARLDAERAMLAVRPEMGKYYRSSAIYPNEDVFIMASDFKTLMWESRGKLPAFREWIFSTDTISAYQYHKRFLQVLQAEAPGTWNLKMPSHALFIETLLQVYPDARLIWTHRDPFVAVGSLCSLISLGHMGFTGKVDLPWIADIATGRWTLATGLARSGLSMCDTVTLSATRLRLCGDCIRRWGMNSAKRRRAACVRGLMIIRRTGLAGMNTSWSSLG